MTGSKIFKEIEERARKETREQIERIRKNIEEKRKREDIICPHSLTVQDDETRNQYTSYWGGEVNECQCEKCNKKFLVNESVEREFICSKLEEKA